MSKIIKQAVFPDSGDEFKVYMENGEYVFEHGKVGLAGYEVAEKKNFISKAKVFAYFKKHTSCAKILKVV